MDNLGWLFYKYLYLPENLQKNKDKYDVKPELLNKLFSAGIDSKIIDGFLNEIENISTHCFRLKVNYPGLMIGVGYFHGLPNSNEDIKTGFFFDYTSGLPIIPASSIKGVLRSFFPDSDKDKFKQEKTEFIRSILKNEKLDVDAIKNEIFEGIDKNGNLMPIGKRDKFLDTMISGKPNGIIVQEYITPHEQFKNPIPIRFVKIAPGVELEFNFILNDGIIGAQEKEKLFFELIMTGGLGAKTNSGYGHLLKVSLGEAEQPCLESKKKKERKKHLESLSAEERLFEENKGDVPNLINKMKNDEIDKNQYDYKKLAELIKDAIKGTKQWKHPKKKAKKRKEYIEGLLKE